MINLVPYGYAAKSVSLLFALAAATASAAEFCVSPQGRDSRPGTKDQPLATIGRGVEATRAQGGPHKIVIRPGTYYLSRPLELDARDSGLTIEGDGDGG